MKQEQKKEREVHTSEKTADVAVHTRGRTFQGAVKKKFPKRVVVEFERPIYIRKYDRYLKEKTRLHARLPDEMFDMINIGDLIEIRECRPLSKIIHFMVARKIKGAGSENKKEKSAEDNSQNKKQ